MPNSGIGQDFLRALARKMQLSIQHLREPPLRSLHRRGKLSGISPQEGYAKFNNRPMGYRQGRFLLGHQLGEIYEMD